MKRLQQFLILVPIGAVMVGCSASTPQADAQVTKQFSGGPMPPDAQKKFQESMARSKAAADAKAQPPTGSGQ